MGRIPYPWRSSLVEFAFGSWCQGPSSAGFGLPTFVGLAFAVGPRDAAVRCKTQSWFALQPAAAAGVQALQVNAVLPML